MRILLDENIPIDFAAELRGHEVSTVVGLGWSGVLNGELMRRARECCDVSVKRRTTFNHCARAPVGVDVEVVEKPCFLEIHARKLLICKIAKMRKQLFLQPR